MCTLPFTFSCSFLGPSLMNRGFGGPTSTNRLQATSISQVELWLTDLVYMHKVSVHIPRHTRRDRGQQLDPKIQSAPSPVLPPHKLPRSYLWCVHTPLFETDPVLVEPTGPCWIRIFTPVWRGGQTLTCAVFPDKYV